MLARVSHDTSGLMIMCFRTASVNVSVTSFPLEKGVITNATLL